MRRLRSCKLSYFNKKIGYFCEKFEYVMFACVLLKLSCVSNAFFLNFCVCYSLYALQLMYEPFSIVQSLYVYC